jgi:hypothetical protein
MSMTRAQIGRSMRTINMTGDARSQTPQRCGAKSVITAGARGIDRASTRRFLKLRCEAGMRTYRRQRWVLSRNMGSPTRRQAFTFLVMKSGPNCGKAGSNAASTVKDRGRYIGLHVTFGRDTIRLIIEVRLERSDSDAQSEPIRLAVLDRIDDGDIGQRRRVVAFA